MIGRIRLVMEETRRKKRQVLRVYNNKQELRCNKKKQKNKSLDATRRIRRTKKQEETKYKN